MSKLDTAREIINRVDKEMARLFEERMDAARLVAEHKKEYGLPIDDPAREEELKRRNSAYIENEEYRSYYLGFLENNIKLSKALQHRLLEGMTVAYSGVPGAFAALSAKRIFPDARTVPYADFKAAYRAVEKGECDVVVLPIENSAGGDVGNVLDLTFFGSLYINGVYEAQITQNLLAVPGAALSDIKKVISHPQALGQCAAYIERQGFLTESAENTALAAKAVAETGDKSVAAIASKKAAEKFGLSVIDHDINAARNNTTRFAIFSRVSNASSAKSPDLHSILLFTVRNEAGALAKALDVIGSFGFNMRTLRSRPMKELLWEYYFYVETEGNIQTDRGQDMLGALEVFCDKLKFAGTYTKL